MTKKNQHSRGKSQGDLCPVKYRIKSYHVDAEQTRSRLLFSIEELGLAGEIRQYAHEIVEHDNWQQDFSAVDIVTIEYVLKSEEG